MKGCRHTVGIKRVITFSTLTCTYLRVKFSIRVVFEWKSKSTHQFTFPIYVKITSVCVTNSFLVCYVTYQTMTYHENKKVRCNSRRNNFWIFLSSHLEEIMVVLPVWQTIHVERLVEEAPESRVRQGADVWMPDLRPEVQAQTPLAVSRQTDTLSRYLTYETNACVASQWRSSLYIYMYSTYIYVHIYMYSTYIYILKSINIVMRRVIIVIHALRNCDRLLLLESYLYTHIYEFVLTRILFLI